MAKIVVVGSLNMDIVAVAPRIPHVGETLMGSSFFATPGGKGANQAYAAAKLGGDVAMLGRIGADHYGPQMCANLAAVGCDVSGIRTDDGASGVAVIFVAETGQNSIVVAPGANGHFGPPDLEAAGRHFADAKFVLLQLESPMETIIAAARMAKSHGATVVLDPAPAPSSLPGELLRHVDILTPNETEALQLAGLPPHDLTLEEARVVSGRLQAAGATTVIIKLGARGCFLAEAESSTWIAAPEVKALDTTAAGDVFNAAMAVAHAEGASLADSCRFAVHAAALSVTRLGAQQSMPGRAELDGFLAGRFPGKP